MVRVDVCHIFFDRKGLFVFDAASVEEEQLMEVALEHGGDDVESTDEEIPSDLCP